MNTSPITLAGNASAQLLSNLKQEKVTAERSELPFADLVQEVIQDVDTQQQIVSSDIKRLANGESEDLQAMAANVAKADLSFRFLMEMRDKLISSYQEVMRMQI